MSFEQNQLMKSLLLAFFTPVLLAVTGTVGAQPLCAPTWLWFDVEAPEGTALESVYYWVTPLNGLTVVVAEGELGFWNGGSSTSEAQICLPEGCYFVGLEVPMGASWEANADFVTDGLEWEMTDLEPQFSGEQITGYTFCILPGVLGGCDVEVEVGMTPNGAYLFEALGGPEGATYSWFVNGGMLQSSENTLFDWYDNLGAPTWQVCVVMDTPEGCLAESCVGPGDLATECTLDLEGGWNGSGTAVFEASNFPQGVVLNWQVNGQWMNMGSNVLEIADDFLQVVTEVCVFYESPACPEGVWACEVIEPNGCVDPELINPDMACTEEYNPVCGCDGVTYSNACHATYYGGVTSWTEGECGFEVQCPTGISAAPANQPCAYMLWLSGATNAAADVVWEFGDGTSQEGGIEVLHVFPENGVYEITVTYASSTCPEGTTLTSVIQVFNCSNTGGCDPVIEAWPSDIPGVWNFLVYDAANPSGAPLSEAVLSWTFSTGETVEGGSEDPIQIPFWGVDEVGWACVEVMCQGAVVETCLEFENPNAGVECENVVIAVDVLWGTPTGVDPLALELVLSMMDVDVDLDLGQILEGGTFNETLSFCLPVGFCFELEAALGNVDLSEVDVFQIAAGIGQELPAWQDVLASLVGPDASWSVSLGVDVLDGCDDSSAVSAVDASSFQLKAFPSPASDRVALTGWDGGAARVVLRNALGQTLVDLPSVQPGESISLDPTWCGIVIVEVSANGRTSRTSLVVN